MSKVKAVRRTSKQKSNKKTGPRLPKNDDYIWQVLGKLVQDVHPYIRSFDAQEAVSNLNVIIRHKNVEGYLSWCDMWSLTEINQRYMFYNTPDIQEIRALRLLTIAQKFDFQISPFDKVAKALSSFEKYEDLCRRTNKDYLFYSLDTDEESKSFLDDTFYWPILHYARDFIRSVMGECLSVADLSCYALHGPGATACRGGDRAIPIAKFSPPFDVTPSALHLFLGVLLHDERWGRSLVYHFRQSPLQSVFCGDLETWVLTEFRGTNQLFKSTDCSRVAFVPKSATTVRTIAMEPTGNIYVQLGIGSYIVSRLKRWGIDLSTQGLNQELARTGSLSGNLVTLDKSGASDTIALSWLELMSSDWKTLFRLTRTPIGVLPNGNNVHFEKVSSMGNGFTFALETLIFASIIYGVIRFRGEKWSDYKGQIAVYGDDVVLPKTLSDDYVSCARRFGFVLNNAKSFTSGPIRESCGKDFFRGQIISRPTFKSKPSKDWELIRDHNLLYLLTGLWGFKLDKSLKLIKSWLTKVSYGPVCEDQISWLFSYYVPIGMKPNTTCNEAVAWQTPVFRLPRTVLRYKTLKKNSVQRQIYQDFEPLMYLKANRDRKKVQPFLSTKASGPWKFHTILLNFDRDRSSRTVDEEGWQTESGAEPDLYFTKQVQIATTSNAIIPETFWGSPPVTL